jgi:hypothetical protein
MLAAISSTRFPHERGPAFDRHVDIGDRESLTFHHDGSLCRGIKASSITNDAIAFSIFSATPEITMPP